MTKLLVGMVMGAALLLGGMRAAPGVQRFLAPIGVARARQACAVALLGTTYMVVIAGPTARAACVKDLHDFAKGFMGVGPGYLAVGGPGRGRVEVCRYAIAGNQHRIYAASRDDFIGRAGCSRTPNERQYHRY